MTSISDKSQNLFGNRSFQQASKFSTKSKNLLCVELHQNCREYGSRDIDFNSVVNCSDLLYVVNSINLPHTVFSQNSRNFRNFSPRQHFNGYLQNMKQKSLEAKSYPSIKNLYNEPRLAAETLIEKYVAPRTSRRKALSPLITSSLSNMIKKLEMEKLLPRSLPRKYRKSNVM